MGDFVYIGVDQPDGGELASQLVSLLCITVMVILFGIKTYNVQFKYLTYSRWLVIQLYVLSWGFTVAAMLFVSTNNGNYLSCLLSELACDIFYSGTKIIIYLWLIEKVWIVSSVRQSRWKTKSYRIHMMLMLPYVVICTLMIVFHISEVQENGYCNIGLQPIASIPLLVYDFIFNLYFSVLFIKPLMRISKSVQADWRTSRLHDVAVRTLAASVVCLLVSFANILALIILDGRERGVLCLTCCSVDVTINVVTVHWVTTNPTGKTTKEQHNSSNNHVNDSTEEKNPTRKAAADLDSKNPSYRRQVDLYNLGIDEYIAGAQDASTTYPYAAADGTLGYGTHGGGNHHRHNSTHNPMAGTAAVPVGMHDHYRYMNGRFVMITEKEDDDDEVGVESRPSSIQGSHSSQKTLTKSGSTAPIGS